MKITVLSDTHGKEPILPGGDLLIHCGDLSVNGFRVEVIKQLNYLHEQYDKYSKIIVIPGNHDLFAERHPKEFEEACLMAGIEVLINRSTEYEGLKIWGSPVTPVYHNWAFNLPEGSRFDIYELIPPDTNLVITHGPPMGILDENNRMQRIGCQVLRDKIQEIKPLAHVFGHCHESQGSLIQDKTLFVNCATTVRELEFTNGNIAIIK